MPNEDTINLLKECDAGCKMGIDSIKQILDKVENKKLYDIIVKYLNDHQKLQNKITDKLNEFGCAEEQPSTMAKAMSHMKSTNILIMLNINYFSYFSTINNFF